MKHNTISGRAASMRVYLTARLVCAVCVLCLTATAQAVPAESQARLSISASDETELLKSSRIRRKLDPNLNTIAGLCDAEKTIEKKLMLMHTAFQNIREIAQKYLRQEELSISDGVLLRSLIHNIPPKAIYYTDAVPDKDSLDDMILKRMFMLDYSVFHNLPDNIKPEDFPDEWARKIYRGLTCLYDDQQ